MVTLEYPYKEGVYHSNVEQDLCMHQMTIHIPLCIYAILVSRGISLHLLYCGI